MKNINCTIARIANSMTEQLEQSNESTVSKAQATLRTNVLFRAILESNHDEIGAAHSM